MSDYMVILTSDEMEEVRKALASRGANLAGRDGREPRRREKIVRAIEERLFDMVTKDSRVPAELIQQAADEGNENVLEALHRAGLRVRRTASEVRQPRLSRGRMISTERTEYQVQWKDDSGAWLNYGPAIPEEKGLHGAMPRLRDTVALAKGSSDRVQFPVRIITRVIKETIKDVSPRSADHGAGV